MVPLSRSTPAPFLVTERELPLSVMLPEIVSVWLPEMLAARLLSSWTAAEMVWLPASGTFGPVGSICACTFSADSGVVPAPALSSSVPLDNV